MLGAIAGDIIGSVYEGTRLETKIFDLFSPKSCFTDDSVLSVAVAEALLTGADYGSMYKRYCRNYPSAGYGSGFFNWAFSHATEPYNSYGNGAPMRVSPVAYAFNTLEEVMNEAQKSALPTHNHPEAVRGARAIAAATFLARQNKTKGEIKAFIEQELGYSLVGSYQEVLSAGIASQHSVPQALIAFLDSTDFEDAIRNAVYIGGDTDTLACMTGAIAEAFYGGVPKEIEAEVRNRLDLPLLRIVDQFQAQRKEYPMRKDGDS